MSEVIVITSGKGGVGKTTTRSKYRNRAGTAWKESCDGRYRHRSSKPGCRARP